MSEKFSLKWNDYSSNWNLSLLKLRENCAFADITLITDNKKKFSAHRILRSSCSNVFDFILKDSDQPNPLLYLSGVNSTNLGFILDYIYKGEVNLYQEQLDSFPGLFENPLRFNFSPLLRAPESIKVKQVSRPPMSSSD